MTTTIRHRRPVDRRPVAAPTAAAVVVLLAVLVALLAGRPGGNAADTPSGVSPPSSASTSGGAVASTPRTGDRASLRVELVAGEAIATATLTDAPEARQLAATLSVSVDMDDPFGRAKPGELPGELDVDDATRSGRYTPGDLSYWSPSGKLAMVYDALGESVPPPGLVRLGTVDTGLSAIAAAGNHFTLTIRRAR